MFSLTSIMTATGIKMCVRLMRTKRLKTLTETPRKKGTY